MRSIRLHPLGVCVLCALSSQPVAAQPPGRVELRLQPQLLAPPLDPRQSGPVHVDAEDIQGRHEQEVEARGNARLRSRGRAIAADWLLYTPPDDTVEAAGNVRIEQDRDVFTGQRLKLNLETEVGVMQAPVFQLGGDLARGDAEAFRFLGPNRHRAERARYTTCGPGDDDWYIRAASLDIDRERQIGTARDASVVFKDTTLFYTPWIDFALDRQRKTGFLAPTFATSGKSGAEFSIPWYWNIAPNRDATITPHLLARRGLMLGSEFRYLEPTYRGEARYETLPNDQVRNGNDRYAMFLRHQQAYGPWVGSLDLRKASDDNYFRDLATRIEVTSQSLLVRQGQIGRSGALGPGGTWGLSMLVQRWQTLQDPLAPITPPYNRQPQITLQANKYDIAGADLEMTGSYVDFNHPTLVNGRRWVAYPSLTLPLQTSYAYFKPKIGLHVSRYDLDPATTTLPSANRSVPIASVEAGVLFERDTALFGSTFLQTLEPKLHYVHIPARDQNRLPNFESGLTDINFATIFAENQYSGNDRINDANQLTAGVTSRMLDRETGIERLRAGLAQRFYFKGQEVTLPGQAARTSSSSDLLAALSATIVPGLNLDAGWQYNTDSSQTRRMSLAARYQPDLGKVMNVGYRFTRDSLEQIDLSAQWPLARGWTGVGRANYSLRDGRLVEGLVGAEYNAGCWVLRLVGYSIAVGTGVAQRSLFVQLELNGVSRVGSNPLEVLKRNISGYTVINEPAPGGGLLPTR